MKKFYLTLFIGLSLALPTKNSFAKPTQTVNKKQIQISAKAIKPITRNGFRAKRRQLQLALTNNRQFSKISSQNISADTEPSQLAPSNHPVLLEQTTDQPLQQVNSENRIHSLITPHRSQFLTDPTREVEHHPIFSVQGVIDTSLTQAGLKAGLSNEFIMQLTNIFAWDIDFATNLKNGDQFTVVYDESNGLNGQILAAEFVTGGKTYTAIRYKDSEGQINYYSPEGKPMRKVFLSAPVDFIRISSGFDVNRKHPILNRIRAHKGVDYAARTGTPVKAAGNGKVLFIGRKGGYGQVLIIEHGEHFETLYAHLSDFKRGLQMGDSVEQGQIVGYVGQTGLATGPHLHYEFRVDGVHQNPEAVNKQQSVPLSENTLAEFKSQSRPYLVKLYQTKANNLLAKSGMAPIN
jgi:murein DD-endopeptidase MepM/ murein hydrolase activator NlpD